MQLTKVCDLPVWCITWIRNCVWHGFLQESWYEKLNRWDEALEAYSRKYQETPIGSPANLEAALGRLRWLALCIDTL